MATGDLTTPSAVATDLGVSSGDARLTRCISAASAAILRYLGRPQLHFSSEIEESVRGFGGVRLLLGVTPVLSVDSVAHLGTALDDWTLEDSGAGFIYRKSGWPWTGQARAGLLYEDGAAGSEEASITVTYSGGFVTPSQVEASPLLVRTLPHDLEEACIQTVYALFRSTGRDPMISAESLGAYSASFRPGSSGRGGVIPDHVLPQLAPFRRLAP